MDCAYTFKSRVYLLLFVIVCLHFDLFQSILMFVNVFALINFKDLILLMLITISLYCSNTIYKVFIN